MDPKVTEEELRKTIYNLLNNKVPGPDNIPNEVLKALNELITPGLAEVVSNIFQTGKLPYSLKQSTTVVL